MKPLDTFRDHRPDALGDTIPDNPPDIPPDLQPAAHHELPPVDLEEGVIPTDDYGVEIEPDEMDEPSFSEAGAGDTDVPVEVIKSFAATGTSAAPEVIETLPEEENPRAVGGVAIAELVARPTETVADSIDTEKPEEQLPKNGEGAAKDGKPWWKRARNTPQQEIPAEQPPQPPETDDSALPPDSSDGGGDEPPKPPRPPRRWG